VNLSWLDTNLKARLWFFFACAVWGYAIGILSGCATAGKPDDTAGVETVCTRRRCYKRASSDKVNERCRRGGLVRDDGTNVKPSDNATRSRCCTFFNLGQRYEIWVAEGEEECLAHEEAHIEIYEDDGFVMKHENHRIVDGFGLGRWKKNLDD